MNRIVVSPAAIKVARELRDGHDHTEVEYDTLADIIDLKTDTVYRAVMELRDLGAIADITRIRKDAISAELNEEHWLWAAISEQEK